MVLQKNHEVSLVDTSGKQTYSRSPNPLVIVKKNLNRKIVEASKVSSFLYKAKGVWPFDFYPDELIVEEKRLVIKRRYFPFYTTVITIPLTRITVFELTDSVFFSGIKIKGSYGDGIDTTFQWLRHHAAQKIKSIVDGLRLKESESVEIMETDRRSMVRALQLIGQY